MRAAEAAWVVGRLTLAPAVKATALLRTYGLERVPREGGVVLAFNHFSWLDPLAFGAVSPRVVYYMAKIELHRVPALGALVRGFGAYSVRRGESDREAIRLSRELVREGRALGFFVEGTRQRSGVPGEPKPGASMIALQERVPVVPAAIHGSQFWRVGNFQPVSIAWGEPLHFDGLAANARGYREASAEIGRSIRTLWDFLVDMHELDRPEATPPALAGGVVRPKA
ncbi:MAG: 1-acyl-sn-glycerol-3-phosphate acyltransferase [Thermoleophilia bacterium]|nr:1-acyl-sn-glycerol-3-phosphate acyltransferase [Thermoleophilia bacterium]